MEYSSSCSLIDGSCWQDTFLPSVKGVVTSYIAFLVCIYNVSCMCIYSVNGESEFVTDLDSSVLLCFINPILGNCYSPRVSSEAGQGERTHEM